MKTRRIAILAFWMSISVFQAKSATLVESTNVPATITVSEKSLGTFWYISPSEKPSAEKKFIVTGEGLTNDLLIIAPKNYEISLTSGAEFTASSKLSLSPVAGAVAQTTIFVRLQSGLGRTNFNGAIILTTKAGVTPVSIACVGIVTAPPHFAEETPTATDITDSSVKVQTNVATNGALPIMTRGVCWSTTENPSYSRSLGKTSDEAVIGVINSEIKGLKENTVYYARPYIQVGDKSWNKVFYGENITFTSKSSN